MTDSHYGRNLFKQEKTELMDNIVLDSIGKSEYKDFKEYKDDMQDFTFKSIFGGGE